MDKATSDNRLAVDLGKARDGQLSSMSARPSGNAGTAERAPRFTLLIRAAKLVTSHGEFVCVIRDVSETGVGVRLFHPPPQGGPVELHMPGGGIHEVRQLWHRHGEAGYKFVDPVDMRTLVETTPAYPKRGLRLGLFFPVEVSSLTQKCQGVVENLSQQGARFSCDGLFAIDQIVRIECLEQEAGFREVRAKIRWRRNKEYGVVFDDTLTLQEFAHLAARLQCPDLLD